MLNGLGGVFGWFLIIAIAGTILNYCLKIINKDIAKRISAFPFIKKVMKVLMIIFVRNHRYFGGAAVFLLLFHFIVQFSKFGLNMAGCIAALLLIVQVCLGSCAIVKKKPRQGVWFVAHRVIAILLILSIALHIVVPNALNVPLQKEESVKIPEPKKNMELQTFSLDELSRYNGEKGEKAYVAYKGYVYDITDHPKWRGGKHNGNTAGTDLTNEISRSPHGDSKFNSLEVVGTIK